MDALGNVHHHQGAQVPGTDRHGHRPHDVHPIVGEDDRRRSGQCITWKVIAVEEEGDEANSEHGEDDQVLGLDHREVLGNSVSNRGKKVEEEEAEDGGKVAFT